MAKTTVDTGGTWYSSLLALWADDGTNFKEHVADRNLTLPAGWTRASDEAGLHIVGDGTDTDGIADNATDYLDELTTWSAIYIFQYDYQDMQGGSVLRMDHKPGPGAEPDGPELGWQSSENVFAGYDNHSDSGATRTEMLVTDGLRGGVNTDPALLTMVCISRDATNLNFRACNWDPDAGGPGVPGINNVTTASVAHNGEVASSNTGVRKFFDTWAGKAYMGAYLSSAVSPTDQNTILQDHESAFWEQPAELTIDTPPASMTRGSTFQMVVSDPVTAPTTGNSSFTIDPSGEAISVAVASVTGSGPYTLTSAAIPTAAAIQHGNHVLRVTVDAETADTAAIALNPPSGWKYTNLSSPGDVSTYAAKTPATGDQVVYADSTSPDSLEPTLGADGEISSWSSTPSQSQTFDYYLIGADGTIYATETYDYTYVPVSISSISNATPQVGDEVTVTFADAKAAVTLSIPAGSLTIDSQTATTATFTVPDPKTFGTQVTGYMEDTTITLDDGSDTDTITFDIQPDDSHYYAVITEVDGIYSDDTGVVTGDQAYGYFNFGGGDVDLATGSISPSENSSFRYWLRDATDDTWGNYADEPLTFTDTTPDQFDLGADAADVNPSTSVVRSFVLAGIDPSQTVTVTATGSAQVSTTGTYGATASAELGDTVFVRITSSATYEAALTGGCTISGVSDEFQVTTRAAVTPTITTQPSAGPVEENESVTLSVGATGVASYQWYRNGSAVSGQTGASYVFTADLDDDGIDYYVILTSSEGGTTQSSTVTLSVSANAAPTITGSASHSVNEGTAFSASYTIANRDGNAPTLSGADAALFSIINTSDDTYSLTMTAKDYETPLDANTDNAYQVTINIDDGVNTPVTLAVTVTVLDISESFWSFTPPAIRIVSFS